MARRVSAPRWSSDAYSRISDATVDDGALVVSFANGDRVRLEIARAFPNAEELQWTDLRTGPFELVVPSEAGDDFELSWLRLRTITDPEFAGHLALEAEHEARRVGQRLRSLRKKSGLSSKELAERAGITPQSLSRIELGRHDVVFTTLQRLLAGMGYSLADLASEPGPPPTAAEIKDRLRKFGFDRSLTDRLIRGCEDAPAQLLERLSRVFGWSRDDLAGGAPLSLQPSPAGVGWFKHGVGSRPAESAYVMYAHYLAVLSERATKAPIKLLPDDPLALREAVVSKYGSLRFGALLKWTWDQGIPVLPLSDRGKFHGACWLVNDRPVICLKQQTEFESRWAFDLAHELGHLALHLDAERAAVIEVNEIRPLEPYADDREDEASDFAGALLLIDPERLALETVEAAKGHVSWLKRAVGTVAQTNGVEVDALANYLAYRLSHQGLNEWWGVATGLQQRSEDAQSVAREEFIQRVSLDALDDDDRALLESALIEEPE
jgi:transcriptional regulator with XRE-family HTH domain/Zn-dependent peptidase ImmA (M78 family)